MIKPFQCRPCSLYSISNGFSQTEGKCTNGVGILGEGLGHNEFIDGLPFRPHGAAGSLLELAFKLVRTDRSQYLIDNIVRCQPYNEQLLGTKFEYAAINHCNDMYGGRFFKDP